MFPRKIRRLLWLTLKVHAEPGMEEIFMTLAQKQQITALRGRGDSYKKIAAALGLSTNTVQSHCRRNGLSVNNAIPQSDTAEAADVCPNCGRLLIHTPGSKRKRFCSDKCRLAWWKTHPEALNRKAFYHFICPKCGISFESYGNAHRKYCSRSCLADARRGSV